MEWTSISGGTGGPVELGAALLVGHIAFGSVGALIGVAFVVVVVLGRGHRVMDRKSVFSLENWSRSL